MSEEAGDAGEFDDYADERDVNDWLEIFWGSLLLVIGLKQLIDPGTLLATPTMQWLGAGVVALGLSWIGHGLKDMAVKEIRESLGGASASSGRTVDYGLIRDVLLHPDQYGKFLLDAYRVAYEDGVLTDQELGDLSRLTDILDIPPREAARIATRAAINCAVEDGVVTVAEMALIDGAMDSAGLTDEEKQKIRDALDDGIIDDDEKKMLDDILGRI
jgi:hypothetical protein